MSAFNINLMGSVLEVVTQLPGSGPGHSAGAGSPFTSYDAGLVAYAFIAAVLVFGLLGGAFLIINLGLLSKRPEDRTGKRTPSDLGILKHRVWPEVPYERAALPAEEEDELQAAILRETHPKTDEHGKIAA
jgi:hypothetical protein